MKKIRFIFLIAVSMCFGSFVSAGSGHCCSTACRNGDVHGSACKACQAATCRHLHEKETCESQCADGYIGF